MHMIFQTMLHISQYWELEHNFIKKYFAMN